LYDFLKNELTKFCAVYTVKVSWGPNVIFVFAGQTRGKQLKSQILGGSYIIQPFHPINVVTLSKVDEISFLMQG